MQYDADEESWQEIVVEDHRVGPAEIAACRIDFASWLKLLPCRLRKIAWTLASGETTSGQLVTDLDILDAVFELLDGSESDALQIG